MKKLVLEFGYATVLLLVAAQLSADEVPAIPDRFNAYIGGLLGPSYSIELRDGTLSYSSFAPGHRDRKDHTVSVTMGQWREFRRTLDDLGIWRWRGDYPNTGTLDGTSWSLDLAYTDRALKTHGDNNYPDASGEPNDRPQPTESFKRYLAAIETLVGGKTFR